MPTLRLDAFLPYRLSIAANLASAVIARAYASLFGISIAEWRLIAVLAEADGLTQRAIGDRTRMDKVTVSRAAIALAGRGLIERQAHGADRRARLLRLSGAGRTLHAQVAPQALALEARLFEPFTAAERATLIELLGRVETCAAAMTTGGGTGDDG